MTERPPDKVTHTETDLGNGTVVYGTRCVWTVPPPQGVELDWIDRALEETDNDVRLDGNHIIIGCTCDYGPHGKADPNCPISFPHGEVARGKRRKHNDDSELGAKIRAELRGNRSG
jgi:hypothetical protein